MKTVSFRNDVLPLKNMLYRLALRITLDATEAEDIVQETLIRVWNKRDTWGELNSIEAFSITICRNLSLDYLERKERQNNSLDATLYEKPDNSPSPFDETIKSDRLQMIRNLINALPEKQRSCMQLRDIEGKSYKDIANALEISEEQVKVNIFRARQTIKQRFWQAEKYGL